jgi:BlaI family penicillinase repressor
MPIVAISSHRHMKQNRPSNLEMQALSVLWEHGPLSARAVMEKMPDKKPRAYTTILSVLQVMEKKGLVTHETEGNRHVYAPKAKQQAVVGSMLKTMVKNIFGGSASTAMQHLLETTPVSQEEIVQMRQLLVDYEKANPQPKQRA